MQEAWQGICEGKFAEYFDNLTMRTTPVGRIRTEMRLYINRQYFEENSYF